MARNAWREYFRGKRVWVTGASSGVGRAMVEALGQEGVQTLASARRAAPLEELAARYQSVQAFPFDMSDLGRLSEIATRAWDLLGSVDVLVNNAGVSQRFSFAEADPDVLDTILTVNTIGPMHLTRQVLARMLSQGSGHIVAVTSLAARIPTPGRTVYSASKLALHGLFDALRGEVEPAGITITLAVPGFVRTDISANSLTASGGTYGKVDPNQAAGVDPLECAIRILDGAARKKREFTVASAFKLRFARAMRLLLPGLYFRIIARARVT